MNKKYFSNNIHQIHRLENLDIIFEDKNPPKKMKDANSWESAEKFNKPRKARYGARDKYSNLV